ncbi:MAG: hypothetical protein ABIQ57_01220, partial [Candidatus Kapaibacterium sp.]
MNEHLNPSELLCAFLDNELDVAETSTLFYALANDHDLQTEMRQLLAMRSAQIPPVAPPDRLRENIMAFTGLAAPALIPPASGAPVNFWRKMFQSRPFLMLMSAGLATLVTTLVLASGTARETTQTMKPTSHATDTAQPAAPHATANGISPAENSPAPIARGNASATVGESSGNPLRAGLGDITAPANGISATMRRDRRPVYHADRITEPFRASAHAGHQDLNGASGSANLPNDPARRNSLPTIMESRITSVPPVFAAGADNALRVDHPLPATPFETDDRDDDAVDERFALELRAFNATSFPSPNISPLIVPPVNNFGAGISYALSRHHAVGIEFGQENFLQEYQNADLTDRIYYQQNYLALWGVASYRFSLGAIRSLDGIDPFASVSLGGTGGGPLGRGMIG